MPPSSALLMALIDIKAMPLGTVEKTAKCFELYGFPTTLILQHFVAFFVTFLYNFALGSQFATLGIG